MSKSLQALAAPTLPQVWAAAAALVPVAAVSRSLSTPDLAYVVRAGEAMLETGHVLRTDLFTFTVGGRAWLNQQWGAEVLLGSVFRAGGWLALAILQAVLIAAASSFVFLACRAAGSRARTAAVLTIAFLPVYFGALLLRPQLLAVVLFTVSMWLVARRHLHPRGIWVIPALAVVWANLHGSFFLAPVILLLAWLDDLRHRPSAARSTLVAAAASAAASMLNPFGPRVWAYAFGIGTNQEIRGTIEEWQPTNLHQVTGVFFFASVLAVVALLLARHQRPSWPRLVAFGVFFLGGLAAVRGARWWGLAAPVYVAMILSETRRETREPMNRSWVNGAIALMFVGAAAAAIPWSLGQTRLPVGSHLEFAPPGLTRTLQRVAEQGDRIFSAQRWGSWFEFAFPDAPVFVDSRIELFPASVWSDYHAISEGRQGWQAILDRWEVDIVVAHRGSQDALIRLASADPRWREAYGDEDGVVFVRA